jgi:hypothetical protein
MVAQDRRLPDQNSRDESSEHRMNTDRVGGERHYAHDNQNRGDDGHFAHKRVVGPANQCKHQPAAERETCQ